jgi:hypothetical protein
MDAAIQAAMAKLDEALALLASAAGPPHPAADKVVAALRTLRDAERAQRLPPAPRPAPPPAQRGASLRSRPGKDSGAALSHAATLPASFLARQARLAGAPVDSDAGGGRPGSDSAESGTANSSGGAASGGGASGGGPGAGAAKAARPAPAAAADAEAADGGAPAAPPPPRASPAAPPPAQQPSSPSTSAESTSFALSSTADKENGAADANIGAPALPRTAPARAELMDSAQSHCGGGGGGGGGGGSAAADKLTAASAAAEAGWRKMLGGGGAKAPAAKPALSKGALAKVAADAAAAGMGKCEGPPSPPVLLNAKGICSSLMVASTDGWRTQRQPRVLSFYTLRIGFAINCHENNVRPHRDGRTTGCSGARHTGYDEAFRMTLCSPMLTVFCSGKSARLTWASMRVQASGESGHRPPQRFGRLAVRLPGEPAVTAEVLTWRRSQWVRAWGGRLAGRVWQLPGPVGVRERGSS